ncbi:14180_t:CDS:2, partial [Cetraspora pellucida]
MLASSPILSGSYGSSQATQLAREDHKTTAEAGIRRGMIKLKGEIMITVHAWRKESDSWER